MLSQSSHLITVCRAGSEGVIKTEEVNEQRLNLTFCKSIQHAKNATLSSFEKRVPNSIHHHYHHKGLVAPKKTRSCDVKACIKRPDPESVRQFTILGGGFYYLLYKKRY